MQFVIYVAGTKKGGWAYDIFDDNGVCIKTENGNRKDCRYCESETAAALTAIMYGKSKGCNDFIIVTSQKYLVDGAMKWRHWWRRNGWRTKEGLDVDAKDMWKAIDVIMHKTDILWRYDNHERLTRLRLLAKQGK